MVNNSDYKLSAELCGHSADVRGLSVTYDDYIVSCSRDKTAKLWKSDLFQVGYTEGLTFGNHNGYVTCVLALSPTEEYSHGLILTGGMDKDVFVFSPENPVPLFKLVGHTDTVCDLSEGIESKTFISSSWDKTAKLWSLKNNGFLVQNFIGHKMAVWSSIQLSNKNIITGSADKSIIIWSVDGKQIRVLDGHADCVRKIRILNDLNFVSVSNDASIKIWNEVGECLDTIYGHTNFIYDVCVLTEKDGNKLVTCGEDRTIRIWKSGQNIQVLFLPAQSVWNVKFLKNGDIVSASSDGIIRIFTHDITRVAEPLILNRFEELVQDMNAATMGTIGGVKIADLPGPEVLLQPGRTNGQTRIVRENTTIMCYQWSENKMEWEKVGDVLGASGGSNEASGKTLHEGKEYDFVFSIDVEDGKPPLKLPYNKDQDPWTVAQKFIETNNLPQVYLEQIADFIMKNSKSENQEILRNFSDPLTGNNRYVPGDSDVVEKKQYIPQKSFIPFDKLNVNGLKTKLKEFAESFGTNENEIDNILGLINGECNEIQVNSLLNLLKIWPEDKVYPLLDTLRFSLQIEEVNKMFSNDVYGIAILSYIEKFFYNTSLIPNNSVVGLRLLNNMLLRASGQKFIFNNLKYIEDIMASILSISQSKNFQVVLATFLLNLTVASIQFENPEKQNTIAKILSECFNQNLNDLEAEFRILVALGTLLIDIKESDHRTNLIESVKAKNSFSEKIYKILNDTDTNDILRKKRNDCIQQLLSYL